jgi:hypothetical protein
MKTIASLMALARGDRALLLKAVGMLVLVRFALHLLPLARLRAWATRRGAHEAPVDRIVWAVSAASRRMPGTSCLISAFALQRLLSRAGYASELHIGVAKRDEKLAAHAWVVCEGRILIGAHDDDPYTPLVAWPAA